MIVDIEDNIYKEKVIHCLRRENKKLKELINIIFLLSSAKDLRSILTTIMDKAKIIMDSEASSLMLMDKRTNELVFYIVRGEKEDFIKGFRLKLGEGIAGWVASTGKPEIVNDVQKHPRFYNKVDEQANFTTRNMLCVPLKTKREIIGTVQVLNKRNDALYTEDDLMLFDVLAHHAAVAIENTRLREQAILDGLTRLYTRRYMDIILEDEFLRARRKHSYLSFAILDIDFFKSVNDSYGHQIGDEVLKLVAMILKENIHGEELAARYGGEEFGIILPDVNGGEAFQKLENIRRKIELSKYKSGDLEISVTVSIGVASYPGVKALREVELVEYADKSLYYAKKNGRNQVILYNRNISYKKA